MKFYEIKTIKEKMTFIGERLRKKEALEWQYYKTVDNRTIRFKHDFILSVLEKEASQNDIDAYLLEKQKTD